MGSSWPFCLLFLLLFLWLLCTMDVRTSIHRQSSQNEWGTICKCSWTAQSLFFCGWLLGSRVVGEKESAIHFHVGRWAAISQLMDHVASSPWSVCFNFNEWRWPSLSHQSRRLTSTRRPAVQLWHGGLWLTEMRWRDPSSCHETTEFSVVNCLLCWLKTICNKTVYGVFSQGCFSLTVPVKVQRASWVFHEMMMTGGYAD